MRLEISTVQTAQIHVLDSAYLPQKCNYERWHQLVYRKMGGKCEYNNGCLSFPKSNLFGNIHEFTEKFGK